MKSRIDTISTAFTLIFFGVVFLLLNTNVVSGRDALGILFTYWPLLIVFGGIKIMVGVMSNGRLINLLLDILFYIIVITVLLLPKYFPSIDFTLERYSKSGVYESVEYSDSILSSDYSVGDIDSMSVKVDVGALEFNLSDSDIDDYAVVTGEYREGFMEPQSISSLDNGKLSIIFNQKGVRRLPLGFFNDIPSSFDIVLGHGDLETELEVSLGAGQGSIDLDSTKLLSGLFSVGAGKLDVSLFNTTPDTISIRVGAGELVLRLDKESSANVTYNVGMGSVKVYDGETINESFEGIAKNGSYSREVNPNSKTTEIDVNVGAGAVTIIFE